MVVRGGGSDLDAGLPQPSEPRTYTHTQIHQAASEGDWLILHEMPCCKLYTNIDCGATFPAGRFNTPPPAPAAADLMDFIAQCGRGEDAAARPLIRGACDEVAAARCKHDA